MNTNNICNALPVPTFSVTTLKHGCIFIWAVSAMSVTYYGPFLHICTDTIEGHIPTISHASYIPDIIRYHDDVIKWKHFPRYWSFVRGNTPITGEFPSQRPVPRSFGVFFDLRLNLRLGKQSWGWWFETLSRYYDVTVMQWIESGPVIFSWWYT